MAEPKKFNKSLIEPFYLGSILAAFSSERFLLATPVDEDIVITDISTNTIVHKIEGDGETVTALAITPDGRWLAVVSQSQQLRVFDSSSGTLVKLYRFSAPVYIAAADKTSSLFAFGATDGVVTVWDIEDGYVTHSLKGHGTTICSLAFYGELHSSNWMLALGDTMGTCKVWNLVKQNCILTSNEHGGAVRGLAFLDDGEYFMTGGRDLIVVLYKLNNLKKIVHTFTVRHQVEKCGFSVVYGKEVFYTAGAECQLKLWDILTGIPLGGSRKPLKSTEELMITDVTQLDDSSMWLVLSDQTLVLLDMNQVQTEGSQIIIPEARKIAGNHGIIADICYAGPDLSLVAMATNAPALRVIDPSLPLDVQLYEGHTDLLNCLDVSQDGLWILTGSKDNTAILWNWDFDSKQFQLYAKFQGHVGAVTACGLSKSSNRPTFIVTAATDFTVKKWKVPNESGTVVKGSVFTRRAHDKEINSLAIAPNDEYFATASFDKTAKVWNLETGDTTGILKGHKRGLWDISFCQYDKLIATSSSDKTAKVWLLKDFSCVKTFEGHTNAVQRCLFIRKNSQLVTSGADGLVKVWDVNEEECIVTLDNHNSRLWALDTKEDGLHLLSADADGFITFWSDNTEQLLMEREKHEKLKVEKEQSLSNYIKQNDWSNAFLLALTLEHLMRVYNVVKASIGSNQDPELVVGLKTLEATMKQLDSMQLVSLLKKIRDWNINFKLFEIAQKVLFVIIDDVDLENGDMRQVVELIIPYSERHSQRLEDMLEESYMLDYVVHEMQGLKSEDLVPIS